jgi:hypothetical protein
LDVAVGESGLRSEISPKKVRKVVDSHRPNEPRQRHRLRGTGEPEKENGL